MKTKTVFLPNSRNPELEAEVTFNGDIVSILVYIPAFNVWIDGMEMLKVRDGKIEEIRDEAAHLNWNDHGDTAFDQWRDSTARIIGVKQA